MDNFDLRKYLAENKLLKEVSAEYVNKDAYNYKVGDIIGNTIQGFDFEVIRIEGDKVTVKDIRSGKEFKTFKDNMYKGGVGLKEELTWFIDDENTDVRYKNDAYLKEVGDKIKELHPDISDEDLNKIIIMTGDQYSREEDFHGDSITSSDFVDAAVEIYQTDILSTRSNDGGDKYFHPDSPFLRDGVFGGWSQAQYDAYQENPRKYEKYLMRGGGWEI